MNETKCCCCPIEVRNLHACAHNLVCLFDGGGERLLCGLHEKLAELKSAVEMMQPLVDQHFAAEPHGTGVANANHLEAYRTGCSNTFLEVWQK